MRLTEQQLRLMDTFGFIKFPGLFANDIDRITNAFEKLWASHGGGHHGEGHDRRRRSALVPFTDQDEYLASLIDDPRIDGGSRPVKWCKPRFHKLGLVYTQISRSKRVENLSLQDIHTDLVADEVIQLHAFARAIETGEGRDWLHNSALATWVLMEACNESARTGRRVDVKAMHDDVLGG